MAQTQEHVAAPSLDRVEPETGSHRLRELSYPVAQAIALLITAGVLIAATLLFVLLAG